MSHADIEQNLKKIQKKTDLTLGALRADLKRLETSIPSSGVYRDFGNAIAKRMLADNFESGDILMRTDKRYMAYNGKYWENLPDDYIAGMVLPVTELALRISGDDHKSIASLVHEAISIVKWLSTTKGDVLGALQEPYPVINAPNAEIWLNKDGSIDTLPHHPDSFQLSCIDTPYNPSAKCPKFDETLLEIFAENDEPKEMRRHLYEILGYAIQPVRDIAAFSMFIGSSNCGKSKIAETLCRLLGDDGVIHIKLESFEKDKDAVGNLLGKRLVIDDDLTQGVKFPDGTIKMLSETKRVTGELKYANKFSFLSYAHILMIGNQYPRIFKADYSIKRRALIVPFKRSFTENEDNRDLFPNMWKDQTEMSGILNECIKGYQRLRERGHFYQPMECKYAYDEWVSGCTFVARFINEICVPNDGQNQTWQEHVRLLYEWADAEGIKVNMGTKEIRKAYENSGIRFGNTGGVLTVKGIKAVDLLDVSL